MWSDLPAGLKVLLIVLAILGVLAVVAGAMYLSLPAHSLPSFFPAHSHSNKKGTKHGIAAIVLGIILLAGAVLVAIFGRRRSPVSEYEY